MPASDRWAGAVSASSGPTRNRFRVAIGATASMLLVLVALGDSAAAAATKLVLPVGNTPEEFVFQPRGIKPETVARARIEFGKTGARHRRVATAGVRAALRKGSRLAVRRPPGVTRARLAISLRGPLPAFSCRFGNFGSANLPGACWRPFSDTSPFNTPVGPAPRLHPQSTRIVSRLLGFGSGPFVLEGGNAGTEKDWDHAIYFSEPDDPRFEVRCLAHWHCEVHGETVRIPPEAQPAGGSDRHLAVIDQASGWEYDFYGVSSKRGHKLTVISGGRTRIGTRHATGRGSDATAAQFGLSAGVIRPVELATGEIDHALFMTAKCTSGANVYPADPNRGASRRCSAIGMSDVNAPALGQRFFLDMSAAEIDALLVPGWQKTILHAMAEYGMYVGDAGGSPWGIQFESGTSYTSLGYSDPWVKLGQQLGLPSFSDPLTDRLVYLFDMRAAVDWASRLRVLLPS
jgi:hypothetical protein